MSKPKRATTSLAGCFGCHMSLLDIDERLLELLEHVELDASPLTDIKEAGDCDIGLIEGGLCNADNVRVLLELRERTCRRRDRAARSASPARRARCSQRHDGRERRSDHRSGRPCLPPSAPTKSLARVDPHVSLHGFLPAAHRLRRSGTDLTTSQFTSIYFTMFVNARAEWEAGR